MNRQRYTRQNIINNDFYQLARFLLFDEFNDLTNDARVLYALLRDRHDVSIKNGWYDEKDEVFMYFKREEMQELLKLSNKTVIKAMKDLQTCGILEEVRQGQMKPNRIYLLTPANAMTRKTSDSMTRKIYDRDPENFRPNQKNINQTKENQTKYIHFPSDSPSCPSVTDGQDATEEKIKNNIDYEIFPRQDKSFVSEIIAIMVDAIMTPGKYITIDGENKPRELVRRRLMELRHHHIELVIDRFNELTTPIKKKRQYILTMLYNCKLELDAHYTNAVNVDMNGGRQ